MQPIPHLRMDARATAARPVILPKLRFGSMGDRFEREADHVADFVVSRLSAPSRTISPAPHRGVQEKEPEESAKLIQEPDRTSPIMQRTEAVTGSMRESAAPPLAILQRTTDSSEEMLPETASSEQSAPLSVMPEAPSGAGSGSAGTAPTQTAAGLETQLDRTAGSGRALPEELRENIEEEIGHDLSEARIHTDETAAQMAGSVNARAFTYGPDIYFASGEFNPTTSEGERLLVHELVHVVQQDGAGLSIQRQGETDRPTDGVRGDDGILRKPLKVQVRPADWNNPDEFMLSVIAEAFHLTIDQAREYQALHKIPWKTTWGGPARGETEHTVLVPVSWLKQGSTFKPSKLTNDERRKRIAKRIDKLPSELKEKLNKKGLPTTGSLDEYEKMLSDLEALAPLLNDIEADQLIDDGDGETTRQGPARALGVINKPQGSKIFEKDTGAGKNLGTAPFDEHVMIVQKGETWDRVLRPNGSIGYIKSEDLATDIPEPGAKLYIVQSGDSLETIAAKHPSVSKEKPEEDTKLIARLMSFINQHVDSPGLKLVDNIPLVVPGQHIWIPSAEFVEQLRKDPSIWETMGDAFSQALEIATGVVAFVAGVLHGAAESLWDLLTGLVDLAKLVWDLFMKTIGGTIVADTIGFVTEIYDLVSDTDHLFSLAEYGLEQFLVKWNDPDTFSRWHFRGWLIGYIIMEVITTFFTAGVAAAVKGLGKGAKIAEFIAKFPKLERAMEAAKDFKKLGKASEEIKDAEKLAREAEELKSAEKLTETEKAAKKAEDLKKAEVAEDIIALRRKIAHDFYIKEAGWTEERAASHLDKIDYTQDVQVEIVKAKERLVQFIVEGKQPGTYFAKAGTDMGTLGINPAGRKVRVFEATEDVRALRSTATDALDTWTEVDKPPFFAKGGGTQYFIPKNTSFKEIP